jgi:hypothetical protein
MPDQPKPASRSDYLGYSTYALSLWQRIERAIEKDITAGKAQVVQQTRSWCG